MPFLKAGIKESIAVEIEFCTGKV